MMNLNVENRATPRILLNVVMVETMEHVMRGLQFNGLMNLAVGHLMNRAGVDVLSSDVIQILQAIVNLNIDIIWEIVAQHHAI